MVVSAVTGAVAWVASTTVTEPTVTPDTPEAVNVGAVVVNLPPSSVNVTVVVADTGMDDGETLSVCALNVYETLVGGVSELLNVPLIETVPEVVLVIVKVFADPSPDQIRVVGENVTPLTAVGVNVPVSTPFGVTVKFVDALFANPLDGPVSVNAVAAVEVIASDCGVKEIPDEVPLIVPDPVADPVKVVVPVVCPWAITMGFVPNVPETPPAWGTIEVPPEGAG